MWSFPWLPGRILPTEVAVAAFGAAWAIQRRPAVDDPVWSAIHAGAARLQLTPRELAGFLGVGCPVIPDPPLPPGRERRLWSRVSRLIGGRG